jgi:hypothetical protein
MSRDGPGREPYGEGDVFAVPLREDAGWAVGVLSRYKAPTCVGYFFGPRLDAPPVVPPPVQPELTVLIVRFGDLALLEGTWPVIGRVPNWSRKKYPIPAFRRLEYGTGRAWLVRYADDDPNQAASVQPVPPAELRDLPEDTLAGAGAVEITLSLLLGPAEKDRPGSPIAHARALPWPEIVERATHEGPADSPSSSADVEQASQLIVIDVHMDEAGHPDGDKQLDLDGLEARLVAALPNDGVEFDGREAGLDSARFYFYCDDADAVAARLCAVLDGIRLLPPASMTKRYGSIAGGANEARVDLSC